MKVIHKTLAFTILTDHYFSPYTDEEILFFDIETTGFSPVTTDLYLIGAIYCREKKWHFIQLFAESPAEQEEILKQFFALCNSYKILIHFNGDTFDIPYLRKKAEMLHLSHPLDQMESMDLIKPVKQHFKLLGLPNYKLKTIEGFLGVHRQDPYTGGELIQQYLAYRTEQDPSLSANLLLHNEEDLYGLTKIIPILDYTQYIKKLKNGLVEMKVKNRGNSEGSFTFILTPTDPLPFSTALSYKSWRCVAKQELNAIFFEIRLLETTLYHFLKDYRQYLFVPDRDEAIHRSIAQFLPRDQVEPARPANCYIKRTGLFIEVFERVPDTFLFQSGPKERTQYIPVLLEQEDYMTDSLCVQIAASFWKHCKL